MKLEQQVSSLELSKTLKNLGVRQESAFYWDNIISKDMDETEAALWTKGECIHGAEFYEGPSDHAFAAFTVAELGEMLPKNVPSWNNSVSRGQETWICQDDYNEYDDGVYPHSETGATEADARAKMLIYLIEKGIINPTEEIK